MRPETNTDAGGAGPDRTPGRSLVVTARETVSQAGVAVRTALGRRDALAVATVVGAGYLLAYLVALGHLAVGTTSGVDLIVVRDPLALLFRRTGPLEFEAVARVVLGPIALLVAPVTIAIGAGLAGLVGLNLALSYLVWRQPAACGIAAGAGPLAALPGLFSGAACCGPALFAAVGLQASGLLLSAFAVLVPVAVLALLVSLLWVGRRVDPERLAAADPTDGRPRSG